MLDDAENAAVGRSTATKAARRLSREYAEDPHGGVIAMHTLLSKTRRHWFAQFLGPQASLIVENEADLR